MSKMSKRTPPPQLPLVGFGFFVPVMQSSMRVKRIGPIVHFGIAIGPSPAAITRFDGSTALTAS